MIAITKPLFFEQWQRFCAVDGLSAVWDIAAPIPCYNRRVCKPVEDFGLRAGVLRGGGSDRGAPWRRLLLWLGDRLAVDRTSCSATVDRLAS